MDVNKRENSRSVTFDGKHPVAEIFKADLAVSVRVQTLGKLLYLEKEQTG